MKVLNCVLTSCVSPWLISRFVRLIRGIFLDMCGNAMWRSHRVRGKIMAQICDKSGNGDHSNSRAHYAEINNTCDDHGRLQWQNHHLPLCASTKWWYSECASAMNTSPSSMK
jgi:hypothetical protein